MSPSERVAHSLWALAAHASKDMIGLVEGLMQEPDVDSMVLTAMYEDVLAAESALKRVMENESYRNVMNAARRDEQAPAVNDILVHAARFKVSQDKAKRSTYVVHDDDPFPRGAA